MIKLLFIIQGITVVAFLFSAVLQYAVGSKHLAYINICFFIANYLIFFGGK